MRSRWATILVTAAALGPAAPVAAAGSAPRTVRAAEAPGAAGSSAAGSRAPPRAPRAPLAFTVPTPSRAHGATVARIVVPSFARERLASRGHGRRVSAETAWSGQAQTLLVLRGARREGRDWVELLLPNRPNGSTGWIPRDNVVLRHSRWWVQVSVGTRTVTAFRDGRRVLRTRAVVGAPGTPTPGGLAAIYERNRQPDPQAFLGPWALSLTALSNVLENYGGGPGRVAIHGRGAESLLDPLGSARSHGCIRIDNGPVAWLAARVPAGTPVEIVR